jgi:hypothetical protein
LRQNGVLWVGSSGNEADIHFTFTPAGPDGPNLGFGPSIAWQPGQYRDRFSLPPGGTAVVLVKWDSWTGSPQDFDVGVVNANGVLVSSGGGADQLSGAPPVEQAFVQNNTPNSAQFGVVIARFSAAANPRFDTYIEDVPGSEFVNPAGSVTMPATSPFAFAVGATCVSTNGLEPFSGRGPTIDGRVKPDISGPDGTSGQVTNSTFPYGPRNANCTSGFTGTSAAAPHVAGAAAVLKSANPDLDADHLQLALQGMAVDAGATGFDNQFGSGRLNLQPSVLGGPSAVRPASGQVEQFVRGTDGQLWQRLPSGQWNLLGGFITSDPDAVVAGSKVDVFARGVDGALWYRESANGGASFGSWLSLGGGLASGPGAASWAANRVDVFVRGVDGALWSRALVGATWSNWYTLGGFVFEPDVTSTAVNRLAVFARGNDNALWELVWNGSAWSAWQPLGGALTSGPGAASPGGGEIDVFARGSDAALWSRSWNGSTWSGWFPLGGGLAGSPDVASPASGQLDVQIGGLDGALWHKTRDAAGVWSTGPVGGWFILGKPTP